MTSTEYVRITTASASREDDISKRQRRYLIAMGLRTALFVAAGATALLGLDWLWPVFIVGAIVLPYTAVVAANSAAKLSDGFLLRDTTTARELKSNP